MPYKHIAAHLNKTELACRLHYHQISHGSGRRRRNASCSSMSSDHSAMVMDPVTGGIMQRGFRSLSPPESAGSASPNGDGLVRLPSIMHAATPPKLPSILPKPDSMDMNHGYQSVSAGSGFRPSLRLETSVPPLYHSGASSAASSASQVDMARLEYIYNSRKHHFWEGIAAEYGQGISAATAEQAWMSSVICCRQRGHSPITPATSPIGSSNGFHKIRKDRTSISSILSDAE